jgi:hypothetical protein
MEYAPRCGELSNSAAYGAAIDRGNEYATSG